jgi:hypothetical protein
MPERIETEAAESFQPVNIIASCSACSRRIMIGSDDALPLSARQDTGMPALVRNIGQEAHHILYCIQYDF